MELNGLVMDVHNNTKAKGFYDDINRVIAHLAEYPEDQEFVRGLWVSTRLMLIVSELGEALEGLRDGNYSDTPKSGGVAEELADATIRIADLSKDIGFNLEHAIRNKHLYNLTHHGRKTL